MHTLPRTGSHPLAFTGGLSEKEARKVAIAECHDIWQVDGGGFITLPTADRDHRHSRNGQALTLHMIWTVAGMRYPR